MLSMRSWVMLMEPEAISARPLTSMGIRALKLAWAISSSMPKSLAIMVTSSTS